MTPLDSPSAYADFVCGVYSVSNCNKKVNDADDAFIVQGIVKISTKKSMYLTLVGFSL